MTDPMKLLAACMLGLLLPTWGHSQSLAPLFPSKEYIHMDGKTAAVENTIVANVVNDSLESGSLSGWPESWGNPNVSVTSTISHSGSYSLVETGPAGSGVAQDIGGLRANQQYVISAWVNVTGSAVGYLYLDDTVSAATTKYASQGQASGWQYISLPFTVDSTGAIRIHLWFASGSGTVYWDDISIVRAVPIDNYSFENGNLYSWIVWPGSTASVATNAAHSGSYSASVSGTAFL